MNTRSSIIARETLIKLTSLKLQPTPDNYQKIYDEISGNPEERMGFTALDLLSSFVNEFPRHTPELNNFANRLAQAIRNDHWDEYKSVLMQLVEIVVASGQHSDITNGQSLKKKVSWADTIQNLLKQLDTYHGGVTIAKKREGLKRVLLGFSKDSDQLKEKIIALIDSWDYLANGEDGPVEIDNSDVSTHVLSENVIDLSNDKEDLQDTVLQCSDIVTDNVANQLLELLTQTLVHVATVSKSDTVLSNEVIVLVQKLQQVQNEYELEQSATYLKRCLDKLDHFAEDNTKLRHGLLRLIDKLLESTGKILSEDDWAIHQISELRDIIQRPLDAQLMDEAENCLDKILDRQSIIQNSLGNARLTVKKMVNNLIYNIEELSGETDEFHTKIENYSSQFNQADDMDSLNHLLVELMQDTRLMQQSTQTYRSKFMSTRAEVEAAQEKIVQLASELQLMSEKVHKDHLTGVLNRRGLDCAYDRAVSRAKHMNAPFSYALLDIDNFKALNDTHGHNVGDEAIVYLVNAIKRATRGEDVVARYGGEEFVILLPDTGLSAAVKVLSRIRRDLTKQFFLHDNQRILITFSAGVAEYQAGEMQEEILKRSDDALYRAKNSGKNLILEAE